MTVGGFLAIFSLNATGWLLLLKTFYVLVSWCRTRTVIGLEPIGSQEDEETVPDVHQEIITVEQGTQCETDQAIVQSAENQSEGTEEEDTE